MVPAFLLLVVIARCCVSLTLNGSGLRWRQLRNLSLLLTPHANFATVTFGEIFVCPTGAPAGCTCGIDKSGNGGIVTNVYCPSLNLTTVPNDNITNGINGTVALNNNSLTALTCRRF